MLTVSNDMEIDSNDFKTIDYPKDISFDREAYNITIEIVVGKQKLI